MDDNDIMMYKIIRYILFNVFIFMSGTGGSIENFILIIIENI